MFSGPFERTLISRRTTSEVLYGTVSLPQLVLPAAAKTGCVQLISFTDERDIGLSAPAFGRTARRGSDYEQGLRNDQGLCGML